MDDIDRAIAEAQAHSARLQEQVAQIKDPGRAARIQRETAAGQTAPPSFLDKLGAAVGVNDDENMTADLARGAKRIMGGVTVGASDALGDYAGTDSPQARAASPTPGLDRVLGGAGAGISAAGGGPLGALGEGAGGLVGMLESRIPASAAKLPAALRLGGRMAGDAAVGGLTGAGANTIQAIGEPGVTPQDVGGAALQGLEYGAGAGAGLRVAGEAAGGLASAVRNSAGGKARALIEKYGGNVGLFDSGSGGAFDSRLQGLTASDKDIGIASQRAAEDVLPRHRAEYEQNVQEPYKGLKAVRDKSPEGRQLRDATPLYDRLNAIADSEALTDAEANEVGKLIQRMETKYRHAPAGGEGSASGETPRYMMSEQKLNEFRQKLDKLSKAGSAKGTTTPAIAELKGVASEARDMVNEEGRPYADINQAYSEGSREYRRGRSQMGLKPKPSGDPDVDVNKLANNVATRGHGSQTAGRKYERLQGFKADNPQFAESLDMPDLLNAKGDLQLQVGGRKHGGLLQRLPPGLELGASIPLGVGEAMMHHSPVMAAGSLAAGALARNWPAVTGRMLYGPAMEAETALAGPLRLPGFVPEIDQATIQALAALKARLGWGQENK